MPYSDPVKAKEYYRKNRERLKAAASARYYDNQEHYIAKSKARYQRIRHTLVTGEGKGHGKGHEFKPGQAPWNKGKKLGPSWNSGLKKIPYICDYPKAPPGFHPNTKETQFRKGRINPKKGLGLSRKEHNRLYYIRHKDKIIAANEARRQINKDKYAETNRRWSQNNKEKTRAIKKAWRIRNTGVVQSWDAKRRSRKRAAMTPTADTSMIEQFYLLAERLTKQTGIRYTVDHIRPLMKGGLHHQDNLQVITLEENSRKRDIYPYEVKERHMPLLLTP